MAGRKRKRKRKRVVPDVLWRLFHKQARTLSDTILSYLPNNNNNDRALVRPEDPPEYRRLLRGCFVVVSENAPQLPTVSFAPHCRWSQSEIVKRTIEMILCEQPSSENLICCGYRKENRTSPVVDALTTPSWTILLKRVGDALMMYLLKYTSIFLPLPRKTHQQVAGFPINNLCSTFPRLMSDSKTQHHQLAYHESGKKRKRIEELESISGELISYSFGSEPSSSTITLIESNGSSLDCNEDFRPKNSDGSSKLGKVSPRKRTRQYRWQRQRKLRQLAVQETCCAVPCRGNCTNSDSLSMRFPYGSCASSIQSNETNTSHCFCCAVFQDVTKMNRNAEVDRQKIFYRLENSSLMFPRKHMLYTLRPNDIGATELFKNIFGTCGIDKNPQIMTCSHSNSCPVQSTCLYHSLIKLLKSIIRETQNCQYLRLLDKHCPAISSCQDASMDTGTVLEVKGSQRSLSMSGNDKVNFEGKSFHVANAKSSKIISEANINQVEPSTSYTPKKQVVSFIWAICRRIVPSPLLGETSNWRFLRKNISNFIHLRKFEKSSLKECIHRLKISKFPLLSRKHHGDVHVGCSKHFFTDIAKHAILKCWIFWFFARLVAPLVQANFYVTDSEHEKQEVLYYRKSTWKKLLRETGNCMKDQTYSLLNHASARRILGTRPFGFSRARLRPKQFGFRVLTNLQAPSRMPLNRPPSYHSNKKLHRKFWRPQGPKYQFFKSVNSVLHDFHVVLKGLCTKEPDILGSSVFDYNDVYRKLVPFLFLLKNGFVSMPSVYIVVSDVLKAFDSVDQDKLLSVMKDVLFDNEYTLEKFIQVSRSSQGLRVHQLLALANQDTLAVSTKVTSRVPAQSSHSILVKKELSRVISKDEFNSVLQEHITRNVVQLDSNFYLQRVGIPQGSVLSALLCSFYYGHMERNVLIPFLEKSGEDHLGENESGGASASGDCNHSKENFACNSENLLLRFIDDFLFITTSKKQASMFFSRLNRGVRAYNCRMNEEKFGLNFDGDNGQTCQSNRVHVGKDGVTFLRWSGLLVNCCTLEIQADYTRYLNTHLSSSLTVSRLGNVGRQLKTKLRNYLRPKCYPIFYDGNINSPGVVRLNIYQVFLLCAMKFLCYISNLSILPKFSPTFYMDAIYSSLRYMNRIIKRKMYSLEVDNAFRPKYDVRKDEVIWLGLYAYSLAIKKKQSRYKELYGLFRSKLKEYGKLESMSPELKYAVDATNSSVLWGIKY